MRKQKSRTRGRKPRKQSDSAVTGRRPKPSPGVVWEAWGENFNFMGFVVTARDDHNEIIGMAPVSMNFDDEEEEAKDWRDMLRDAQKVASDLAYINDARMVVDYRDRQGLDAKRPMPAEVYGYRLCPAGTLPPARDGHGSVMYFFRPSPFCRFRFAAMLDQFLAFNLPISRRNISSAPYVSIGDESKWSFAVDTPPEIFRDWQRNGGL